MRTYKSTIKSQTPKIFEIKYIIFLKKHKTARKIILALLAIKKKKNQITINGISYFAYRLEETLKN